MSRFSLLIFIFFVSFSFIWGQPGQEKPPPETEAAEAEAEKKTDTLDPFPLGPMLVNSLQKAVPWRPDWALPIPPDAFRAASGQPVSISLSFDDRKYQVRWAGDGRLMEFPCLLQGQFVQVQVISKAPGNLEGLFITGSDQPWQVDFIGDRDAPLSRARITRGETVCFVALHYDPVNIAETWYDQEGTALADFTSRSYYAGGELRFLTLTSRYEEQEETADWYYYDSFGNISEIRTPAGVFSILYSQEQRPRYWKRQELTGSNANYTLQWDKQGFLVRISETSGGEADEELLDIRYEYTLDSQGNWIERREIRLIRRLGVLVSSPGLTVKRVIIYKAAALN